jgi:hypothetical protein
MTGESLPKHFEIRMHSTLLALVLLLAQDPFSGPQPGEPLPDCRLKVVLGPNGGSDFQLLEQVGDQPNLVIFVHDVTRPAIGLVRTVATYAQKRAKDGLAVHLVFLTADPTETETWMNRARGALPSGISIAISPDGIEGPGAFGLNRKMQVTAIVAKDKKVTANFAIVQPSMQTDAQKIGNAIAKTLGDAAMPTQQELGIQSGKRPMRADGKYERLMRPFIQKNLSDEDVLEQAAAIEKAAAKDPALKQRMFEVVNRIIQADKLSNYGTAKAQEFLTKWSKEFAQKDPDQQQKKDSEETDNGPSPNSSEPSQPIR